MTYGLSRQRQHGNEPRLAALAQHVERIVIQRRIAAGKVQGFRDAQPAPVEKQQHRTVAGDHPLRRVARAGGFIAQTSGGGDTQGARHRMGELRSLQPRQAQVLQHAILLKMPIKGTHRRQLPGQGAAFGASVAPRREKRAEIGGGQDGKIHQIGLAAQMIGQEAAELRKVAPIGLGRLGGSTPLDFQKVKPADNGLMGIGLGGEPFDSGLMAIIGNHARSLCSNGL